MSWRICHSVDGCVSARVRAREDAVLEHQGAVGHDELRPAPGDARDHGVAVVGYRRRSVREPDDVRVRRGDVPVRRRAAELATRQPERHCSVRVRAVPVDGLYYPRQFDVPVHVRRGPVHALHEACKLHCTICIRCLAVDRLDNSTEVSC